MGLAAYEAGSYKTLCDILTNKDLENNFKKEPLFDIIIGCSMGAINAALITSYVKSSGNWKGSSDQLVKFWKYVSVNSQMSMSPDFTTMWEKLRKDNPNLASTEATRQYYAAKKFLTGGVPNVFSAPSIRMDNKYLDPSKFTYIYDKGPIKQSIKRFVNFPLATSFENREPRLLLVSVDVAKGMAVTFDSYEKGNGSRKSVYGDYLEKYIIEYNNGLDIQHVLASLSHPDLYDPEYINDRAFWDGSILNNSPLRELIHEHTEFWKHKTGINHIPDLDIYTISAWPSKINNIPNDYDGIKASINAISSNGKLNYDEKVAEMVTDYTSLVEMLIDIAKGKGALDEVENVLNRAANTKFRNGKIKTYKDLITNYFSINCITQINRKTYLDDVSNQWADFTSDTIDMLIREGYRDAGVSLISIYNYFGESTKEMIQNINTISAMGRTLETIDKISQQIQNKMHIEMTDLPSTIVEQQGDTIQLKVNSKTIETITPLKLMLAVEDKELIQTYEKAMMENYKIWRDVYPELQLITDLTDKAKQKQRLDKVVEEMCKSLYEITEYFKKAEINLGDKYKQIQFLCRQQIS